ncbi:unnamed protein product [Arctogadus glacialis]
MRATRAQTTRAQTTRAQRGGGGGTYRRDGPAPPPQDDTARQIQRTFCVSGPLSECSVTVPTERADQSRAPGHADHKLVHEEPENIRLDPLH